MHNLRWHLNIILESVWLIVGSCANIVLLFFRTDSSFLHFHFTHHTHQSNLQPPTRPHLTGSYAPNSNLTYYVLNERSARRRRRMGKEKNPPLENPLLLNATGRTDGQTEAGGKNWYTERQHNRQEEWANLQADTGRWTDTGPRKKTLRTKGQVLLYQFYSSRSGRLNVFVLRLSSLLFCSQPRFLFLLSDLLCPVFSSLSLSHFLLLTPLHLCHLVLNHCKTYTHNEKAEK